MVTKAVNRPSYFLIRNLDQHRPCNGSGHSFRTTKPGHFICIAKTYLRLYYKIFLYSRGVTSWFLIVESVSETRYISKTFYGSS